MEGWKMKSVFLGIALVLGVSVLIGRYNMGRIAPPQEETETRQDVSPEAIESYLIAHVGLAGFGGRVFCAYTTMGREQNERGSTTLFLWALCQEYTQQQHALECGTGISVPVALIIKMQDGTLGIQEHRIPMDGSAYERDVRAIFPQPLWPLIIPGNDEELHAYNQRATTLDNETKDEAARYFGVNDCAE